MSFAPYHLSEVQCFRPQDAWADHLAIAPDRGLDPVVKIQYVVFPLPEQRAQLSDKSIQCDNVMLFGCERVVLKESFCSLSSFILSSSDFLSSSRPCTVLSKTVTAMSFSSRRSLIWSSSDSLFLRRSCTVLSKPAMLVSQVDFCFTTEAAPAPFHALAA